MAGWEGPLCVYSFHLADMHIFVYVLLTILWFPYSRCQPTAWHTRTLVGVACSATTLGEALPNSVVLCWGGASHDYTHPMGGSMRCRCLIQKADTAE